MWAAAAELEGVVIKVTVVVPLYNTGPAVMDLVRSLDAQTLEPGELEVVLVDDGSTDDTYQRVVNAAESRPYLVVDRIPNSGWPGRPRNVGLARARGDFVFFADHDDEFFPDALRRMHAMAVEDGADVVYGKVVRVGAATPYWPLAHADLHRADPVDDGLLISRSTHKLYRRQFLLDNDIRFLEGRVRLEDHHFMGQVLAHRPVVSVLASYPCYRWIHRNDGTNNSSASVDLDQYFGYFAASVRLLQAPDVDPRLQRAVATVAADRMFLSVRPRSWASRSPEQKADAVRALRQLVQDCVPPAADAGLGPLKRRAVAALRADDLASFDQVQEARRTTGLETVLETCEWRGATLHLAVSATLQAEDEVVEAEDRDGSPVLRGGAVGDVLGEGLAAADRPGWDELGTLEVTVRHAVSRVEWPVRSQASLRRPEEGPAALRLVCEAQLDPDAGALGAPLEPGTWQVLVRSTVLGESQVTSLRVAPGTVLPAEQPTAGGRPTSARRTQDGRLVLKVAEAGDRPRPRATTVGWEAGRLRVTVDPAAEGSRLVARVRSTGEEAAATAESPLVGGAALLALPPTDVGDIVDLVVVPPVGDEQRVAYDGQPDTSRRTLRVYQTANGSLSLKHLPAAARVPVSLRSALRPVARALGRGGRRRDQEQDA